MKHSASASILQQEIVAVLPDHDLGSSTCLRAPAIADGYAEPRNCKQLIGLIREAHRASMPVHILGNGSNVLLSPRVSGLVICVRQMQRLELLADRRIYAEAGCHNACLIQFAAANGLSGLEFAIGIPGSVGGLVVMNANFNADGLAALLASHGFEDVNLCTHPLVESVDVVSPEGELLRLNAAELAFGYRSSVFQHQKRGWAIVGATFRLAQAQPKRCRELIQLMAQVRARKEERGVRSLGCVFRPRDPSYLYEGVPRSAQWFLDRIEGLPQWRDGGIAVDQRYANHLVNRADGTMEQYLALAQRMRTAVRRDYGVELLMEIQSFPHGLIAAAAAEPPLRAALADVRQAIDRLDRQLVACSCGDSGQVAASPWQAESFARDLFRKVGASLRHASIAARLRHLGSEDLRVVLAPHDYSHLPSEWFLSLPDFLDELCARGLLQNNGWVELMVRRLALVEEVARIKMAFAPKAILANRRLPSQERFAAHEGLMRQLDREHELFPLVMALCPPHDRSFVASIYKELILPYSFALQHLYFQGDGGDCL